MSESTADVQQYLIYGLEKILSVTNAEFEEHAADAFEAFKKGVIHANNIEHGNELLASLGTKVYHYQFVLKFLIRVYGEKEGYRGQVIAVLQVLLHVDSWLQALQQQETLVRLVPAEVGADELIASAQQKFAHALPEESGSTEDIPEAPVFVESFPTVILAENPSLTLTLAYLEQGARGIAALGFAVDPSSDNTIQAFNAFQLGITRALLSKTEADVQALVALEPKADYLVFLLAISSCKPLYHSRAKSVLRNLLSLEPWRAAAVDNDMADGLLEVGLTCEGLDASVCSIPPPLPPQEKTSTESSDLLMTIPLKTSSGEEPEKHQDEESQKNIDQTLTIESDPAKIKVRKVDSEGSSAPPTPTPQKGRRRSTLQTFADAFSIKFGRRHSVAGGYADRARSSTTFSNAVGAGATFGELLKGGELEKQSPSVFHAWQKRSFRLHEFAIVYSAGEEWQPQGKQCIPLNIIQAVHLEGLHFDIITTTRGEGKPYRCRGTTEKEAKEWVDAISAAVENCNNAKAVGKLSKSFS